MKRVASLAGLLLLALPALGQLAYSFSPPQPSRIPGLQEYRATITNFSDTAQQAWGMSVYEAAEKSEQRIQWVADVGLNQIVQQWNKHGPWYYAGIMCEVGGYAGAVAVTGKLTEIKERLVVFMPIGATACSVGRMVYTREHPKLEVPRDLLQPLFTVPAHTRVNYAIWGR